MNVTNIKLTVITVLFIGTFLFSMMPVVFLRILQRRRFSTNTARKIKAVISLLSCYAAGVFLATCLLDLFPSVREKLLFVLENEKIENEFPISEFIVVIGMFFMLIMEQIVLFVKENRSTEIGINSPLLTEQNIQGSYNSVVQDEVESSNSIQTVSRQTSIKEPLANSPIRSMMLLLALSMHSIFEGLAIGLQPTKDLVLQIFAALALHKCIIAFSLGLTFIKSRLSVSSIVKSNILFSVTSPIGISVGIIVIQFIQNPVKSFLIVGSLEGLAAGSFLYVVFFEILPHEFNSEEKYPNRLIKVLLLILGFTTICLVMFLHDGLSHHHGKHIK